MTSTTTAVTPASGELEERNRRLEADLLRLEQAASLREEVARRLRDRVDTLQQQLAQREREAAADTARVARESGEKEELILYAAAPRASSSSADVWLQAAGRAAGPAADTAGAGAGAARRGRQLPRHRRLPRLQVPQLRLRLRGALGAGPRGTLLQVSPGPADRYFAVVFTNSQVLFILRPNIGQITAKFR